MGDNLCCLNWANSAIMTTDCVKKAVTGEICFSPSMYSPRKHFDKAFIFCRIDYRKDQYLTNLFKTMKKTRITVFVRRKCVWEDHCWWKIADKCKYLRCIFFQVCNAPDSGECVWEEAFSVEHCC